MKVKAIWYRVIVSEDEEQEFLRAMEDLALIYDKDLKRLSMSKVLKK